MRYAMRRWCVALVAGLAAVIALIVIGIANTQVIHSEDICVQCGMGARSRSVRILGMAMYTSTGPLFRTTVSEILSPGAGTHEHRWESAVEERFDWRGSPLDPRVGKIRVALCNILHDRTDVEPLAGAARRFPDLPDMIRKDILQEPDDHLASRRYGLLRNVDRNPRVWELFDRLWDKSSE